ncbi:MAG TPA: hypothetical protein VFE96_03125 [Candidatus Bathyarchaeia archaeon]|jgi:hypothetical protein|nr:hypothetical protein [Candidatus Bathyarchaeia archaeon]
MKMYVVVVGVILLIAGIGGAAYYGFVPRTRVYGAIGVAVVGIIIAALGAMMKTTTVGAGTTGEFKCAKCGATFGSQSALDQHTKDKHGM